jgi:adenylylsulfate kinase
VNGVVVWITGVPAAGKSTFAERLQARCPGSVRLDGDELRALLGGGYDPAGRDAVYRRLAGLAALLARQGLTVIVAATAHRRAYRGEARRLAPRFLEVWIDTPPAEAERRDPKGLYAAARAGRAPDLPGVGVPYEPPEHADVRAAGGEDREALERIVALLGHAHPLRAS